MGNHGRYRDVFCLRTCLSSEKTVIQSEFYSGKPYKFCFAYRYTSLDVKNILLESVLHHILPQLLASPLWSNLKDILESYLGFMQEFFLESAEMTVYTYRHKSYSKVCLSVDKMMISWLIKLLVLCDIE